MRLCLAVLAVGAVSERAGVATADNGFVESTAAETLPSTAGVSSWSFETSACGSTDCVSVGYIQSLFGGGPSPVTSFVIPILAGVPGPGVAVQLPSGANLTTPESALLSASCWSSGSCVAVGDYSDASGNQQSLVVPITNGVVGAGIQVPVPADAASAGVSGSHLDSVSCSPWGACVAVGSYLDAAGSSAPLVISITNGLPGTPERGLLPGGSAPAADGSLNDVSCTDSGWCLAVGTAATGTVPFIEAIDGGVPSSASSVSLPAGVSGESEPELTNVSCWAVGACAAVGDYVDSSGYDEDFVVPVLDGSPGGAVALPLPPDAGPTARTDGFNGVACQSSGACLALEDYFQPALADYTLAVPITEGVVGASSHLQPSMSADVIGSSSSEWTIGCPPSGQCLLAGSSLSNSGFDSFTETFSGGTLGSTVQAPGPPNGAGIDLASIACGASGSCIAPGTATAPGGFVPYVLVGQAPLAIESATSSLTAVGLPYQGSVSATGGWDEYRFSLSAGRLPPGLSLNAGTGVISGTATTPGTANFSVTATTIGAPVQTATQVLSLKVLASTLRLATHSVVERNDRVALRLTCLIEDCTGIAKLQITEKATARHHGNRADVPRSVTAGRAQFAILGGHTGTVSIALTGAGRRVLAHRRRFLATVDETVSGGTEKVGRVIVRSATAKH